MNTPHTHPRATEFLYVVNGTGLSVGFIEENGARFVSNTVLPGEGTLFPKGSIHFQQNLGCDPLTFVAALNNVDPGVLSAAQRCTSRTAAVT
jgi:oxalate decarboxylase/phosphoglucose isomerase-like protein (cupin superfamily)